MVLQIQTLYGSVAQTIFPNLNSVIFQSLASIRQTVTKLEYFQTFQIKYNIYHIL